MLIAIKAEDQAGCEQAYIDLTAPKKAVRDGLTVQLACNKAIDFQREPNWEAFCGCGAQGNAWGDKGVFGFSDIWDN